MPFKFEKLDPDKDNSVARFRLTHTEEPVDVTFTYATFRESLDRLNFSSNRIGAVLKLLHKQYPYPIKKTKTSPDYTDAELIEYLKSFGLVVRRRDFKLDPFLVIRMLELRGYEVAGFIYGEAYTSPVFGRN